MVEYKDLMLQAVAIAENAAKVAASYFRQPLLIDFKEDFHPVTIADKKAEESIRKDLEKAFPDWGIIGEELGEVTKASDFIWTVDPIDGTRSFIRGIPLFGTLLGLMRKNQPVLGVMVLPALNETYWSALGMGAYCNGHQIHVSATATLETSIICHADINCFEGMNLMNGLLEVFQKAELVRGYTDCFGHALVVRGSVDAMIDPIVSIWDIAPIASLVSEAGGKYFDFFGNRNLRSSSFVSCTPALEKPILELLSRN